MELKERLLIAFYIRKALEEPGRVVHIPGLGSLWMGPLDRKEGEGVFFESGFGRDGLDFSAYLAGEEDMETVEARILVNRYVDWIAAGMMEGRVMEIDGVGFFYSGLENDVCFSRLRPDPAWVRPLPVPGSTGRSPERIASNTRTVYLAIGVIVIALLSLYFVGIFDSDQWEPPEREEAPVAETDSLPFDTTAESTRFEREKQEVARITDSIARSLQTKETPKDSSTGNISKKEDLSQKPSPPKSLSLSPPKSGTMTPPPGKGKFYVIVGVSGDRANADALAKKLAGEGFSSGVLEQGPGKWRVHAGKFSSHSEAKALIGNKLAERFPEAWVLELK